MGKQWYVGTALVGREKMGARELNKQGFETYVPMCVAEWAIVPKIRPLLVGYVLIRFDQDSTATRWQVIFSTYGMKSVLHTGDRPQSVPDWIVDDIKSREVLGLVRLMPRDQCKFKSGDKVTMQGSPFEMVFHEPVDGRRAEVFLTVLGRIFNKKVPLSKLRLANAVAG